MRLKSEIWAKAYIRSCATAGVPAVVVHHGDDDAGAIFVRVNRLDGTSLVFGPAPAGLDEVREDRVFMSLSPATGWADAEADARLAREMDFDRDVWIIETEDRQGRHLLDDWLAPARR